MSAAEQREAPAAVLVAFDKFKDALSAGEACRMAAHAVGKACPQATVETAPLTDGGEGFCSILTETAGGSTVEVTVTGPWGESLSAPLGRVELASVPAEVRALLQLPDSGSLAIVEMAAASGLEKLSADRRDVWQTSTCGTGELLAYAAREGASAILLGIGGSATSDLGTGLLEALGVAFRGRGHEPLAGICPACFAEVETISSKGAASLPPVRIACDVDNPLLGPNGAAAVYGPQKGLKASDYRRFEQNAAQMAHKLCQHFEKPFAETTTVPGSGAAGGIGFGLRLLAEDARYVPGFPLVEAWLGLSEKCARADIVLTGEGRFDASSLQGKGPAAVARAVHESGGEAWVFAGAVDEAARRHLPDWLDTERLVAITPEGMPLPEALSRAGELLDAAIRRHLS